MVLRSSVLMDERKVDLEPADRLKSPIDWDSVTFLDRDHIGITKDDTFIDNILFKILESPRAQ